MAPIYCTVCGHADLERSLDFGLQPLSTRFTVPPDSSAPAARHPLSIGYCRRCLAIQLVDRFPLSILQQKTPAIRFREPVAHLPDVVELLMLRGLINTRSRLAGLSYIDEDLLSLFEAEGCAPALRLHTMAPFNPAYPGSPEAGLETLQTVFSNEKLVTKWIEQNGQVDLLSARFILEHAESALAFIGTIKRMVEPGGYILVEVPDVSKMLAYENHALVWEDHFTYFNPASLSKLATLQAAALQA